MPAFDAVVWEWIVFSVLVVVLLTLDLLVFHRHDHVPTLRESVWWTVFWIGTGLTFNAVIWWWKGHEAGVTFLTAFLIEKSLSMDNIFVFVVIFRFFAVPLMYQYRVLFWGILGAIGMRLAFILAGVELIHRFDWVAPLFGAFLVYTAYKLARHSGAEVHPENNPVLRMARRFLRITRGDHHQYGHAFFAREGGRLCITPMFLALLVIESTDVVFAVDSVPAVIGIIPKTFTPSQTMFIAFSSNVFAILGLRALYFLLAGMVDRFRCLHYGLAAVLGFVGLKMIAEHWLQVKLAPWVSLLVVAGLLAVSIVVSLLVKPGADNEGPAEGD
ncbi:MAG: TerC/Alx family metal homeostasis membrane protein [Planctomycetales bacterium]|nr:TerC/Alx family metal homeostasis membrane protein [Planctomycetales bacterium]